ncbi:MAG: hypothetical protein Q4Q62_00985 [Thermoplasmata archaeon]|nr:hypothetical protein [Thermoplasmata archaeon]
MASAEFNFVGALTGVFVIIFVVMWMSIALMVPMPYGALFIAVGVFFLILGVRQVVISFRQRPGQDGPGIPLDRPSDLPPSDMPDPDRSAEALYGYCPYCGSSVETDYGYCRVCGKRIA